MRKPTNSLHGLTRQMAGNTAAVPAYVCTWEQTKCAYRHLTAKSVHVSVYSHLVATEANHRSTKIALFCSYQNHV